MMNEKRYRRPGMSDEDYIFGIRAIIEAIKAGKNIETILMRKDLAGGILSAELTALIKENNLTVKRVPIEKLNRITRKNHQGVIAKLSPIEYWHLPDFVASLYDSGAIPLIVVLDGITDTRNFGAIARTCDCAGVDGIVIPEHGSVSVTADAVKTSAGALLHLPVCRDRSASTAVRYLKESGFRIIGLSEKAEVHYTEVEMTVPTALVLGAEDTGLSEDVIRQLDETASIPMFGEIGSLNVSVAAGIVIYEAVRQRLNSGMAPQQGGHM